MTTRRDDGYILASVLGVLLAISIVAATLLGTSGDSLRRIRKAEALAAQEATLQSALTLIASQLVQDPRRRAIKFTPDAPLNVLGKTVKVRIGWESSKIDVNLADPDVIEARLQEAGLEAETLETALDVIRQSRAQREPISLLTELKGDQATQACLASRLTVFGGQSSFESGTAPAPLPIGRPSPGSRLAIDLAVTGEESNGLSAVILITGDAKAPWQVMDWRRSNSLSGEACHAV